MVEHVPVSEGRSTVDQDSIEQRILGYSYNLMLVHYTIQPGVESSYHNHPHEQIGFVHSGEAVQIVDGEEYPLEAGTCYRLNSGEKHAMRAVGEEPLQVIDVFHPVREDYLPE